MYDFQDYNLESGRYKEFDKYINTTSEAEFSPFTDDYWQKIFLDEGWRFNECGEYVDPSRIEEGNEDIRIYKP